jgi:hypothetical protein
MILNLTQHEATVEQCAQGVAEPNNKSEVQALLTFSEIPSARLIAERADRLARVAVEAGYGAAMIGGATFLMAPLERALARAGVRALHAFTLRESLEVERPDGGVRRVQVFRHLGFVGAVGDG